MAFSDVGHVDGDEIDLRLHYRVATREDHDCTRNGQIHLFRSVHEIVLYSNYCSDRNRKGKRQAR